MHVTLFEKYRPRTLDGVIGQDKATATLRTLRERIGFAGQAFWISGPSGTGKTTLARIVAQDVADEFGTMEFDSADAIDAQALSEISAMAQLHSFGRGGRAIIINEAHALTGRAIRTMLGLLERIPSHVVYIFTTTREGQEGLFADQIDAAPLLSRCIQIRTTNQGFAKPFAERAREIAQSEGLDGKPVELYIRLMQDVKNNARAALQQIASGAMLAK